MSENTSSQTPACVLSIVVPVFNERATVERAIERMLTVCSRSETEVIVVDDGSTDGTAEILKEPSLAEHVTVLQHQFNRGKGAAVRTGLAQARGEFTTVLDADLEYDPGDLPALLAPLREGRANAVLGVRAFDGYTSHSLLFVMGNRTVTFIANVLFNVYLGDLMTCHKMIRTEIFKSLPLREPGFAIEAEIVARLLQSGERVFEIPVSYQARASSEGKKLTWIDGLRVVRTLVRCRFSSRLDAK